MKQLVILLLLMVVAGIGAALWLLDDAGYVLLMRDGWQLETTLGFALFVLVLAATGVAIATLLLAAFWDVVSPFGAGGRWRNYLARHRLQAGFYALVDGHWQKAGRLFAAAARAPEWRVMAALGAAQAAFEQGDEEQMRQWLALAQQEKRGRIAAGLLAAHLALQQGYPGEARNELQVLREVAPKNPRLLRLLGDALARSEAWNELAALLPSLRRQSRNEDDWNRFEQSVWRGWMKQVAEGPAADAHTRLDALRSVWKKMPDTVQQRPAVRAQYAGYLAQFGDGEAALTLIRKTVADHWDDRLPAILECITNVAPERLLSQLESWLESRPGNSTLLLTAGRVSLKAQLWGKARAFFDAAGHAGNATALAELARLSAALGDNQKAVAVLEERLRLLDAHLPDLPLPQRQGISE